MSPSIENNSDSVIKELNFKNSEKNILVVSDRFLAVKDHLYSELKGEGIILSLKNGRYYGVNDVGRCIWLKIQTAATFQEIQSAVLNEYNVDENTCRQEVFSFLERMVEEDLVEVLDEKAF